MNGDRAPPDTAPSVLDSAFGALKTAPNRHILGFLLAHPKERLDERNLALDFAAWWYDKPLSDVTSEERDHLLIALRHSHLPRLGADELISRREDEGWATLTDHPLYEDPGIKDMLLTENGSEEEISMVCRVLSNERRRTILAVLDRQSAPISAITLAELVTSVELDTPLDRLQFQDREPRYLSLLHTHLPRLHDAGLIERTSEGITYRGHRLIRTRWLNGRLGSSVFRRKLPTQRGRCRGNRSRGQRSPERSRGFPS